MKEVKKRIEKSALDVELAAKQYGKGYPAGARNGKIEERRLEVTMIEQSQQFLGPLPHPDTFAAYDAVIPGATERILQMAEKEQQHRIQTQTNLANAAIEDTKAERKEICRSQWLAWTLSLIVVSIGGGLIYLGHAISGTLITGGTIIGIISAFLNRPRRPLENTLGHTDNPSRSDGDSEETKETE